MVNDSDFQKAIELINKSESILITTHTKPDGDACGCIAAMCDALGALGKNEKSLMLSPVSQWYEFLFAEQVPVLGEDVQLEELIQGRFSEFDLIVIVDTNSYSQLPKFDQYLKQTDKPVLVIDHHVTTDGLGTVELVESQAAATALIVHDLFKYARWPISKKIAQALFVAVATDTGWFQFSNTDSRVFQNCAELIEAGANPMELYRDLYQNFSPERFKLLATMLNSLELHFDGRYATQYLRQQDFKQTGASYNDTENFINEYKRIGSVEIAALFVELRNGQIRCSMRGTGSIDVRNIMQKFGGGGHAMAAACTLDGPLEDAKNKIQAEIKKQFI